mgnify:CR=1 FL=1
MCTYCLSFNERVGGLFLCVFCHAYSTILLFYDYYLWSWLYPITLLLWVFPSTFSCSILLLWSFNSNGLDLLEVSLFYSIRVFCFLFWCTIPARLFHDLTPHAQHHVKEDIKEITGIQEEFEKNSRSYYIRDSSVIFSTSRPIITAWTSPGSIPPNNSPINISIIDVSIIHTLHHPFYL